MNDILCSTIAIIVVERYDGTVNRQLLEIGAAVAIELSIKVGEDSALKQRVVGKVNATHDMPWLKLLYVRTDTSPSWVCRRTMICSVSAK